MVGSKIEDFRLKIAAFRAADWFFNLQSAIFNLQSNLPL